MKKFNKSAIILSLAAVFSIVGSPAYAGCRFVNAALYLGGYMQNPQSVVGTSQRAAESQCAGVMWQQGQKVLQYLQRKAGPGEHYYWSDWQANGFTITPSAPYRYNCTLPRSATYAFCTDY